MLCWCKTSMHKQPNGQTETCRQFDVPLLMRHRPDPPYLHNFHVIQSDMLILSHDKQERISLNSLLYVWGQRIHSRNDLKVVSVIEMTHLCVTLGDHSNL